MNKRLAYWRLAVFAAPLLAALAGCTAATTRAPVVDRSTGAGATAPAAPVPAETASYTVRKNDTLYSIAWRHNVDYKALAAANQIDAPYTIYPGRRLRVPGPGTTVPAAPPAPAAEPAPTVARRDTRPAPSRTETPAAPRRQPAQPATRNTPVAPRQAPARPAAVAAATPTPKPPPARPAKPKATAAAAPPRPPAPKPSNRSPTPKAPATAGGWRPPVTAKPTRRFGGTSKGYDYALPPATTVRAAAPGEVVYAGPGLGGFRHLVIVKASERYLVAYGINVAPKLKEGETVALGAPVAEVGSGGAAAGRFHFEIRDRGKPVDPGTLLGGA